MTTIASLLTTTSPGALTPGAPGAVAPGHIASNFPDLLFPALADTGGIETRQVLAGDGSILPVGDGTDEKGDDTTGDGTASPDAALAWLGAIGVVPPVAPAAGESAAVSTGAIASSAGLSGAAPPAPPALNVPALNVPALNVPVPDASREGTPVAAAGEGAVNLSAPVPADAAMAPAISSALSATGSVRDGIDAAAQETTAMHFSGHRLADTGATTAQVIAAAAPSDANASTPGTVAPAAQTFADAIRRAFDGDRTDRDAAAPTAATVDGTAASGTITAQAVAATGNVRHDAVDTTRAGWPEAMIGHIEKLRDMADANDMSIRLVPDALGTIDVSLRRDGDQVQVRLTAAEPQTQRLLADAQPRLTELASERGLRLSHVGSDSALAGQSGGSPQQQTPSQQQPARPASAFAAGTATGTGTSGGDDDSQQRIA